LPSEPPADTHRFSRCIESGMRQPHTVRPRQNDFDLEKVRLVSDLRIMHAKVDELHHVILNLRKRHGENDVITYADEAVLSDNISRVDEIYLWFVKIKEQRDRSRQRVG
jgi:hypothetical protein